MTSQTKILSLLAGLLFALPAQAWEIGEFKNGMTRNEVDQALKTWSFDKTLPIGNDGLFAYDLPNNPAGRRFLFTFCNDKLVAFDQEVAPSFRSFVVIASNYSNLYGNPLKVIPYSSVVASGVTARDVLAQRVGFHGRQIRALPRQRTTLDDLAGQQQLLAGAALSTQGKALPDKSSMPPYNQPSGSVLKMEWTQGT